MLDIKFIRQNTEIIKEGCRKKQVKVDIDKLLTIDEGLRKYRQEYENWKAKLNKISKSKPNDKKIKEAKDLKYKIKSHDTKIRDLEEKFQDLMFKVPIPPAFDVPEGKNENDNVQIKSWGKQPKFNFPLKNYIAIMESLDLLDLKRGAKIGGFRQYVIKNEAVLIEQALLRWSLDHLTKKGFTLFRPTIIVKEFALIGTGMFPKGKEDTYKIDDDLYLAGTTEVPLMAYHADEILEEK